MYVGVKTMATIVQSGRQVKRLIMFMVITCGKWGIRSGKSVTLTFETEMHCPQNTEHLQQFREDFIHSNYNTDTNSPSQEKSNR